MSSDRPVAIRGSQLARLSTKGLRDYILRGDGLKGHLLERFASAVHTSACDKAQAGGPRVCGRCGCMQMQMQMQMCARV